MLSFNGYSQEDTATADKSVSQGPSWSPYTSYDHSFPHGPISQVVRMMFQDSKGKTWFGTQNGAFQLTEDVLVHLDAIRSESGKGVTIKDITEGADGTVWLGHSDGISSVTGEVVTNYYTSDGLLHNDVWCLEADANGRIWIGTYAGVCVWDGQVFTPFPLPEGQKDTTVAISGTRMVHSILHDSQGQLWFSTNAGLFRYTGTTLTDFTDTLALPTRFVSGTFEDPPGTLWIATKEGLYSYRDQLVTNITAGSIDIGKGLGSVAADKEGTIWFVANQHHLYTYDGQEITEFQPATSEKGPVVFQVFKDRNDRLCFVGFGGAFRLEQGGFVPITRQGPW